MKPRSEKLTAGGKKMLKIVRHLEIASAVADGRAIDIEPKKLSAEAAAAEAKAIAVIRGMIRSKYLTRDARRIRARRKRGR